MQYLKAAAVCGSIAAMCACADSSRSLNPTAPSAVVASRDLTSSTDAVSVAMGKPANPGNGNSNAGGNGNGKGNAGGNGNGNAGGNGNAPAEPGSGTGNGNPGGNGNGVGNPHNDPPTAPSLTQQPTNSTPRKPARSNIEIEGLIGAIGDSQLSVGGQSVAVTSSTVIRHDDLPLTFDALQVGDRVHVKATRVTTDSVTTIEASEVNMQNAVGHDDDDGNGEEEVPTLPLVAAVAVDATAVEGTTDTAIFLLTRSGDTTAELTVTITLTGTATNGVDYDDVPLVVTFAAGQATANVEIVAKIDALADAAETVTLTVVDGAGYLAGAPSTGTVGIAE